MGLDEDALDYHERDPPGKLAITTTKPTNTQRDLSLAYSPGVAAPCREIAEDPEAAFKYTSKGNMVGVVSNGSAVLGLGDIGAQAGKPVMEGKGVLFKRFADVDVFDVELDLDDPDAMIEAIAAMEPTFGGVNIEDITAPECFEIESALRERMDVPVFHDDQHGTAIISGAALLNAADIADKDLGDLDVVFSGAGASAIASARFYISLGVDPDNVTMVDSTGIITEERADEVNTYKREFARDVPEGDLADVEPSALGRPRETPRYVDASPRRATRRRPGPRRPDRRRTDRRRRQSSPAVRRRRVKGPRSATGFRTETGTWAPPAVSAGRREARTTRASSGSARRSRHTRRGRRRRRCGRGGRRPRTGERRRAGGSGRGSVGPCVRRDPRAAGWC